MFLPEGEAIDLVKDVTFAYDQIDVNATQPIGQPKNTNYDQMQVSGFVAPSQGYIMIYLSNESNNITEVYFDDLTITLNEHPIIQTDNFYPFGLQHAGGYQRITARKNNYLFHNKTELIDDLDLGWYDFKYRMHNPKIGRFFTIDPLAEGYYYNSPYAFAENKLGRGIELEGLELAQFGPGTNPFYTMQEGFRRLGDAALSLFSIKGEVYGKATRTQVKAKAGSTTFSTSASTTKSFYVLVDFSDILNYPSNNELVLPDHMIEVGSKTTATSTESVTTTTVIDGVPINTTLSSTQNATDQSTTNTAEVNVGLDQENVKAKAYINVSSTTDSEGNTTNKANAGVQVESPVYKDEKNTISIGSKVQLTHEIQQ